MYPLFETIRILDGRPQHLEWHQERLDVSFYTYFNRYPSFRLDQVIRVPEKFSRGEVKCRVFYGLRGCRAEYEFYFPRKISTLRLVEAGDLDYSLKYTDRDALNDLLKQKQDCEEVLIIRNGLITDTTYTNIVFFDGERWITPQHPLLEGTSRNRLVASKQIFEGDIRAEDLNRFRFFRLINAMMPFGDQADIPVENIRE